MANDFSHFPKAASSLSNHEWARAVKDIVSDLNELLAESTARDVTVLIEQTTHQRHEHPILSIKHLAENI